MPGVPRAAVIEAFWSVQGEGRFVGSGMAFLRLATCPIRCTYCDTPHSYHAAPTATCTEWGGRVTERGNPLDVRSAVAVCRASGPANGWSAVSVTGGEPLAQPEFVAAFAEAWAHAGGAAGAGGRVHLETAALDPGALERVLPHIHHLSADYKLPGTLEPASGDPRPQHIECLRRAAGRRGGPPSIDVKLVLTPSVRDVDLDEAFEDLGPFAGEVELVLQPVTPYGAEQAGFDLSGRGALVHARALEAGFRVRVLPQVHKALQLP